VATNGDELNVVEPDWLEMERRQIDALGPKFEALVVTLMRQMGSVPEKREEVRSRLYRGLYIFVNQSGLYQEIANAKPRKWLKRVHDAAKALEDLLNDAIAVWPTPDAEWADLRGRLPDGLLTRLAGDVSRLVAVTKDTSDMHRSVGRRRHQALHEFVDGLADTYEQYTGKKAGRSRRRRRGVNKGPEAPSGPFFRFVEAALSAAGVQMSAAAIDSLVGRVIKQRRG
jgi:hypothetical protein